VGVVPVPDERLDKLSEFSSSKKVTPAVFEFVDIAGLIKGAAEGEGLGNAFLENIRSVDALAHVVRVFDDSDIHHVEGSIAPVRDIETITLELVASDYNAVQKRLDKLAGEVRTGDKEAIAEQEVLERAAEILDDGRMINEDDSFTDKDFEIFRLLGLLSTKPMLFVFNTKTGDKPEALVDAVDYANEKNAHYVVLDAALEFEMSEMEEGEKADFRGEETHGLYDLITAGYKLLDLITFLTTGEKETRGWPVNRGSTAPEAAGRIHSDFEEKFIRAEVIGWEDLLEAGSRRAARENGLIRTEGSEYVVEDGDVIEFLHG